MRNGVLLNWAIAVGLLSASVSLTACDTKGRSTEVPAAASTSVISLQDIDCQSCGEKLAAALGEQAGVYAASFDRKLAELTVQYDAAQAQPADFTAKAETFGYVAVEGAGHGRYLEQVEFGPEMDFKKIASAGEAVQLDQHLASGKVTVFDFYAEWCKPCREVDRHMKGVLAANPDVALRKLDIIDWDSELAALYLNGVEGLPYVVVFGPNGKKVASISGLDLDRLDAAIEKGRSR